MEPSKEIKAEYPFLRIYADGRVERLVLTDTVPSSTDPTTGVTSTDVVLHPDTSLSARLYLPTLPSQTDKLPVLVYYHGGAFCVGSAFGPLGNAYLNILAARARVLVVSVEYRLAPEHPLPAAYDDSWAALKWVASHAGGDSMPGTWIAEHGDLGRVFLGGDSAGANIAHHMAMRAGAQGLPHGVKITGIVLAHPYFWGSRPVGGETADEKERAGVEAMWRLVCPGTKDGCDDPWLNPAGGDWGAPSLKGLGCRRVLVCVAERDQFKWRGMEYAEELRRSGWGGEAEVVESEGEGHAFHIWKPRCDRAVEMMERLVNFINRE